MIAAPVGRNDGIEGIGSLIQVENQATQMAEAIGLAKRRATKRRNGRPSCEDCFFHCHMLCALDLDEPCSTFRPNTADGLVPPRQPALLPRQAAQETAANPA
jgi:hypothetical protein